MKTETATLKSSMDAQEISMLESQAELKTLKELFSKKSEALIDEKNMEKPKFDGTDPKKFNLWDFKSKKCLRQIPGLGDSFRLG